MEKIGRAGSKPVMKYALSPSAYQRQFDMTVIVPPSARAPAVCCKLLSTGRNFACLVPSDLVSWISKDHTGKVDEEPADVELLLQDCSKIVQLDRNFTRIMWIEGASSGRLPGYSRF